jgi:hypothetical protein
MEIVCHTDVKGAAQAREDVDETFPHLDLPVRRGPSSLRSVGMTSKIKNKKQNENKTKSKRSREGPD